MSSIAVCCSSRSKAVVLSLVAAALPLTLAAQSTPENASHPKPVAPAKPQQSAAREQAAGTMGQTLSKAEQETLARAAGKVLDQIQDQEFDLYTRLTYFEKPERLNPASFASVDEVRQWKSTLEQMKQKSQQVADLYTNVSKNLDQALRNAQINAQLAAKFKAVILEGFPWETIQKKDQLMQEYIGEHGKLLAFYETNWGTWKPGADPAKPVFGSPQEATAFQKLREQIISTGQQLDAAYRSMSQ
jgi:hemerythrin superfamily protein